MIKVDAQQMKELDRKAQEEYGIPGLILMENAGLRASEVAIELLKKRKSKKTLIFCGPGNNGGDGFVVARHLLNNKFKVKIFLLADESKIKGDALINFNILRKMKTDIEQVNSLENLKRIKPALKSTGLVVDGIFGIGLNKDIGGIFKDVIDVINRAKKTVIALDIPSGLCADTGKIFSTCICAHTTVTFGAAKKGFFKGKGKRQSGKVVVSDISFPQRLIKVI
ncbi:MAG: NAD(P)H-hydrate epimerase [PVC group bacterium]|nr:NAD(P)H-hydrate epimerase [PVC group bacterium]